MTVSETLRSVRPLDAGARRGLAVQRAVARIFAFLSLPLVWLLLRVVRGYRIRDLRTVRRRYRELVGDAGGGVLICANHLTMVDGFLLVWALASPLGHLRHFSRLPWNVPDRTVFAGTALLRGLWYALKCLPIPRGGTPSEVSGVLARLAHLLSEGDTAIVFPEGGRSRSGRVRAEGAASGVGHLVRAVPGCRVLCVYLRGDAQEGHGAMPRRGDRIHVSLALVVPESARGEAHRSKAIARGILDRLAEMERSYFAETGLTMVTSAPGDP